MFSGKGVLKRNNLTSFELAGDGQELLGKQFVTSMKWVCSWEILQCCVIASKREVGE